MKPPQNGALTASIDWLEFTVLDMTLDATILNIMELTPEDFTPLNKGRFGYKNQMKWSEGNVFLMFNAKEQEAAEELQSVDRMGIHVMITGSGCRQYEAHHQLKRLLLYLTALDEKVNFTRIDLAIDDFAEKIINFSRIHQAALDRLFTSRWNKWDELNSRKSSDGEFIGRTMYFGSQASDIFCRIYDKALERKANGDKDVKYPDRWTRLEIIYRKERARQLIYHLVDNRMAVGNAIRGTLNQYIRFLVPVHDSNKARWPTAEWWQLLLAGVGKLTLTVQKEEKTIDDMTEWVDRQIAPTIAAILTAKEGDMEWLHEIIVKGAQRLSQRHRDAIAQYLEQQK